MRSAIRKDPRPLSHVLEAGIALIIGIGNCTCRHLPLALPGIPAHCGFFSDFQGRVVVGTDTRHYHREWKRSRKSSGHAEDVLVS
jgi:hypothetical protein